MPRAHTLVCKYTAIHGAFPSPLLLRNHYATEHASEWKPPTPQLRQCNICDKVLSYSSVPVHMRAQHHITGNVFSHLVRKPGTPVPPINGQAVATPPPDGGRCICNLCGTNLKCTDDNLAKHFNNRHHGTSWRNNYHMVGTAALAVIESPPEVEHTPEFGIGMDGVDVDSIVLPVIHTLAYPGDVVPVHAMAALFIWRDATRTMLGDISKPQPKRKH